ncbi:hypothetical protein APA386B_4P2 (plasmid) [Acetobacter pasteurianus 386B]|nr:hypothetical protein APA386B_4P2 [Acetobacter pasteurianus 386B]
MSMIRMAMSVLALTDPVMKIKTNFGGRITIICFYVNACQICPDRGVGIPFFDGLEGIRQLQRAV